MSADIRVANGAENAAARTKMANAARIPGFSLGRTAHYIDFLRWHDPCSLQIVTTINPIIESLYLHSTFTLYLETRRQYAMHRGDCHDRHADQNRFFQEAGGASLYS
jgi:hypothetical protein